MKLKVSSEIITSANSIDNYINEISKSISKIQNYLDGVSKVWQGADATSFVNKFTKEAIPELQNYAKIMKEYQTYLKEVYPIYESLDEYYDKKINT